MTTSNDKKTWTEPELIVLERRHPEEFVLGACKSDVDSGAGSHDSQCLNTGPSGFPPSCSNFCLASGAS